MPDQSSLLRVYRTQSRLALVVSLATLAGPAHTAVTEHPTSTTLEGATSPSRQPDHPGDGSREIVPVEDEAHVHDGFYVRTGFGVGYVNLQANAGTPDETITGEGVNWELLLGGTLESGFVVGGGLVLTHAGGPKSTSAGGEHVITSTSLGLIGVLGQYYFDDTSGTYLQGVGGIAIALNRDRSIGTSHSLWGVGVGIAVGHDFWVGEHWSIGPAARLSWASLRDTDQYANGVYTLWHPSILLGATLH